MTATLIEKTLDTDMAAMESWMPDPKSPAIVFHERFFAQGNKGEIEQRTPAERIGILHGVIKLLDVKDSEAARFLMKVVLLTQRYPNDFGHSTNTFFATALRLLACDVFKIATKQIPLEATDWRPDKETDRLLLLRDLVRFCGLVRPHRWSELREKELKFVHNFLLAAIESEELQTETGITEDELKTVLWKTACTAFIVDRGEMCVIPELYAYLRGWARSRDAYPPALLWGGWKNLPNFDGGFASRYLDGGESEKYLDVRDGDFADIAEPKVDKECANILALCGNIVWHRRGTGYIEPQRRMLLELFALFSACRELAKRDLRR